MSGFHPIQVSLPDGTANRSEATGADGVHDPTLVHAVRKLEVYEVICRHLGNLGERTLTTTDYRW